MAELHQACSFSKIFTNWAWFREINTAPGNLRFSDTICPQWEVWAAIWSCFERYVFAPCESAPPRQQHQFPLGISCSGLSSPLKKHHYVRAGSAQLLNGMRRAWFDWLRLMPAPDTAADNVFLIKPSFQLWHRCQPCHRCLVPGRAQVVTSCARCTVHCSAYHAALIHEKRDCLLYCLFLSHAFILW